METLTIPNNNDELITAATTTYNVINSIDTPIEGGRKELNNQNSIALLSSSLDDDDEDDTTCISTIICSKIDEEEDDHHHIHSFSNSSSDDDDLVVVEKKKKEDNTAVTTTPMKTNMVVHICHLRPALKSYNNNNNTTNDTTTTAQTNVSSYTVLSSSNDIITNKKQVTFYKILIRVHSIELGDNPSCSIGTPIQLGWDVENEIEYDVDMYEIDRIPKRRKQPRHFLLNYYQRLHILQNAGFTESDIENASKEVSKIRQQRGMTRALMPICKVEEVFRSAGRKVKKFTTNKKKKNKNRRD